MRSVRLVWIISLVVLGGCALPPADQPAYYSRMGRFVGLVANCGCSDISVERISADYPLALGGRYAAAEVVAMKGYVELGATERWSNHIAICAEICSQRCMVQAVVEPLKGKGNGEAACLVSERDLHLPNSVHMDMPGLGRD